MKATLNDWMSLDEAGREALLRRPAVEADAEMRGAVRDILARVKADGDAAVIDFTARFDGVQLDSLAVSPAEFTAAEGALGADEIAAIDTAIDNVRRFHEAQLPRPVSIETAPGVVCERVSHPLDAVGLYVPAGTAPLPSAAVMLAVPAAIAGCPVRVLCTPPRGDGSADPAVLVAASRAGVRDVFKIGGAQAVAAMAFGTATVPAVNKIFGPGNAWVTCAKTEVSSDPDGAAIDMPAGPSEVLVIADANADPAFVASDLLSQAEHGTDSQVLLVTDSRELAERVAAELATQLARLSRRDIAAESLGHSRLIVVDTLATAVEVSNCYAPEHLILQCAGARALLDGIRNAGSVFVGPWTPESVGDYCSGTNHVLPTYGYARNYSGLGVDQFMRHMTIQELSRDGLAGIGETVTTLARLEGLDAHAAAVTIRLGGRQ
jgi:histidinol dehydrogenase